MPIRPENRWLYPIDWPELSKLVRFGRARSRCEHCLRPHLACVSHLGDGRWYDEGALVWRSGSGRPIAAPEAIELPKCERTRVVLACAHLDHDPTNNKLSNLAALCQRCHMIHDAREHRRQRIANARRRRACRDLFQNEGFAL
jgi:hypothetical protein